MEKIVKVVGSQKTKPIVKIEKTKSHYAQETVKLEWIQKDGPKGDLVRIAKKTQAQNANKGELLMASK